MYENLKLNRNFKEINSNLNIKIVKHSNKNKLLKNFDDIVSTKTLNTSTKTLGNNSNLMKR
jgi:hypothetical protein